jgi:hypothetical protein
MLIQMQNTGACVVLLIIVCASGVVAGCTTTVFSNSTVPASPATGPVTVTATLPASSPFPATTVTVETTPAPAAVLPATTVTGPSPVSTATLVIPTTYVPAPDDPYVNSFLYNTSYLSVSSCVMQEAFPTIAGDTSYGTRSANPHVTGISAEDMNNFYTNWIQANGQSASIVSFNPCGGGSIPDQSWWDFIQVHGVFTPRNARPASYGIILNVRARNYGISQITYNETLTLGQTVYFYYYIPVQAGQINDLQGIDLQFKKITP